MVIRIENCTSVGNGGDGVRIEGNPDVEINGLTTADNGGEGLNVISNQSPFAHEKRWFEKPFGIVFLAVVGAVLSGGMIYYFGWS